MRSHAGAWERGVRFSNSHGPPWEFINMDGLLKGTDDPGQFKGMHPAGQGYMAEPTRIMKRALGYEVSASMMF